MNFDPTGYTWVHEHLHIDLSGFKNNLDCRLDQYDLSGNEGSPGVRRQQHY